MKMAVRSRPSTSQNRTEEPSWSRMRFVAETGTTKNSPIASARETTIVAPQTTPPIGCCSPSSSTICALAEIASARSQARALTLPRPAARGPAPEALDAAARVDELLLAGVERMAGRADLDVELRLRRAGIELVAARAANVGEDVVGMDAGLHSLDVRASFAGRVTRSTLLGSDRGRQRLRCARSGVIFPGLGPR